MRFSNCISVFFELSCYCLSFGGLCLFAAAQTAAVYATIETITNKHFLSPTGFPVLQAVLHAGLVFSCILLFCRALFNSSSKSFAYGY